MDPFDPSASAGHGSPPASIVCPDCGGPCGLLSHPPEGGFAPEDVLAYRCRDCLDRWDVIWEPEDFEEAAPREPDGA